MPDLETGLDNDSETGLDHNEEQQRKQQQLPVRRNSICYQNRVVNPEAQIKPDPVQIDLTNRIQVVAKDIETFRDFSMKIREAFSGPKTMDSLTLDVIALYLYSQKIIYIESKTFCEQKLNMLMLPAIFLSAVCTVLSLCLKDIGYGATIVASFTATNSFILAVINYMKLDAKAEAHRTSSYRFDKLQTQCEFFSGKIICLNNPEQDKQLNSFVDNIEKQIQDIKDTNQFVIPEAIRYRYPHLYSNNIFSDFKKIKNEEKIKKMELHTIYNKLNDIPGDDALIKEKDRLIRHILQIMDKFLKMDTEIEEEIRKYINSRSRVSHCCSDWLKT